VSCVCFCRKLPLCSLLVIIIVQHFHGLNRESTAIYDTVQQWTSGRQTAGFLHAALCCKLQFCTNHLTLIFDVFLFSVSLLCMISKLFVCCSDNLPKKLADVAWDRVKTKFPLQYQRNAIASQLASQLVYSEGIHLVESQATGDLAERAFQYYRESKKIASLVNDIESKEWKGVDAEQKKKALDLIRRGGARTSLGIF
jgi:hypothetical protein